MLFRPQQDPPLWVLRLRENWARQEKEAREWEEGCIFCGRIPVCPHCGRCYDRSCNAGCIFCRTPVKGRVCPCCGSLVTSKSLW